MKHIIALIIVMSCCAYAEEEKPSEQKILLFGQSGAFSGPMGLYGYTIRDGINAYFDRVNRQGGVKGYRLQLVSMDDKGKLPLASKHIKDMRDQGITMFIGNMGNDHVQSLVPDLKRNEIALFFPWIGSYLLRDASLTSLINGPGFMEPQLTKLADYVVQDLGHKRIAVFHADDSFSTSSAQLLADDLRSRGKIKVEVIAYNRMTLMMKDAADKIKKSELDPRAIIGIGTSVPIVKMISHLFAHGRYASTFLGIDSTLFVGDMLRGRGIPFYYTAAVQDPKTSSMPIAQQYLHDIARYRPDETPNVLSFTYYLSAALLVAAMKACDGKPTREQIIKNIEKMQQYNLDGFTVSFDAKTRHLYGTDVYLIKG